MIEKNHPSLSVGARCRLLSISRSSFYYAPQGETAMNLDLMLKIDKQFLDTPFYGVRQMTWHLQNEGHAVNQKRIRRLMRLMRLMPIYQKPDTSRPAKGHKTYPYLLGGLRVERPNQVLLSAMPASPAGQWVRRHHLSAHAPGLSLFGGRHGLVHAQGAGLAHLEHAGGRLLRRSDERGDPQVRPARDHEHRSGQPVHLLRLDRSAEADRHPDLPIGDRKQSPAGQWMDGKGRCLDNIFIERLWRSLKYECVYLHAWETGSQAKAGIGRWIAFYNQHRPHTAHGGQPPAVVYFNTIETDQQAQAVA